MLHIEWGAGTGGGGTGGGGTGGGGTGVPVMSPSTLDIGRSVFQGALVQAFPFDMMNSGQAALNYTVAVTYNSGSGWLTLSPAAATGSVAPGEKQAFTVDFNTAGLTPGTYEAMIRFTDANASNSPQDIRVSLSILTQAANTCNEAPLYTKSVSSPAVMVLLDCSGSMVWGVDLCRSEGHLRPHARSQGGGPGAGQPGCLAARLRLGVFHRTRIRRRPALCALLRRQQRLGPFAARGIHGQRQIRPGGGAGRPGRR